MSARSAVSTLDERHRKSRAALFAPYIERLHAFAVELAAATVSGNIYQAAELLERSQFFQPLQSCKCCKHAGDDPLSDIVSSLDHLRGETIAHAQAKKAAQSGGAA